MKQLLLFIAFVIVMAVVLISCSQDSQQVAGLPDAQTAVTKNTNDLHIWGERPAQTFGGKGTKSTTWLGPGTITLCGTVFCSPNCSNIPDNGYSGMGGIKVNLQGDFGSQSAVTDANGHYCFTVLAPDAQGASATICVDMSTIPAGGHVYPSLENGEASCSSGLVFGSQGNIDFGVCGLQCQNNPPPPGPCTVIGSINGGFNGTSITGTGTNPGYLWFNSNFSIGAMAEGKTVTLTNSVVTINGTPYNVPDAVITFTNSVSCATTSFSGGKWQTFIPVAGSDEIFLSGLVIPLTTTLPGGAKVNWTGTISTDQPGVCLKWKYSAASYKPWPLSGGSPDYNAAMIKASHNTCAYNNGDHAGTPENPSVKASVTGGAMGGGGSNWTGSWTGTGSVCPICP